MEWIATRHCEAWSAVPVLGQIRTSQHHFTVVCPFSTAQSQSSSTPPNLTPVWCHTGSRHDNSVPPPCEGWQNCRGSILYATQRHERCRKCKRRWTCGSLCGFLSPVILCRNMPVDYCVEGCVWGVPLSLATSQKPLICRLLVIVLAQLAWKAKRAAGKRFQCKQKKKHWVIKGAVVSYMPTPTAQQTKIIYLSVNTEIFLSGRCPLTTHLTSSRRLCAFSAG